MSCILICIALIYTLLIVSFIIGFERISIEKKNYFSPNNTFSIIIPFRNEAKNLPKLLNSISALNYPENLFEILLVNDASTDEFHSIINEFKKEKPQLNISLIENERSSNSPKKDAINTAVKVANFDWIVTTDADCEVPENWLQLFNQCIEKEKPLFISAPVKFISDKSFLFHFQNLNFISLMGSTIGGFGIQKPFMCNGANLCYNKNTFFKLDGFDGNNSIASGDDIFLLEKFFKNFPKKTRFLKSKESIVKTAAEHDWKSFMNQQLRWASKSTSYSNLFSKFVGLIVFLTNLLVIVIGFSTLFSTISLTVFGVVFILKIIVDFILILKTSRFLNNNNSLIYYIPTSLLYPLFTSVIGILSFTKGYSWKGRAFKK